jgi:Na+-transporting NADH:ubiquinone oxidoreductase subunit NqrC
VNETKEKHHSVIIITCLQTLLTSVAISASLWAIQSKQGEAKNLGDQQAIKVAPEILRFAQNDMGEQVFNSMTCKLATRTYWPIRGYTIC